MNDQDKWLETNLDAIGRAVPLPDEPTDLQSARWTAPAARLADGAFNKGDSMRFYRWLSGGISIAAALAVCTAIFLHHGHTVSAATIFNHLRQTVAASRITSIIYHDVASEEPAFPYQMDLRAIVQREPESPEPDMYLEFGMEDGNVTFNIAGNFIKWNMQGSATQQTLVYTPQRTWAFYQVKKLADDFYKQNPSALPMMPLLRMAQTGVYIDNLNVHGGYDKDMRLANMNIYQMSDPENFSDFLSRIEARAGKVDVSTLDDGTHVLEAGDFGGNASELFSDFAPHGNAQDPLIKALFADAVFQVLYRRDSGVQQVRVMNLGAHKGEIRIAFDDHAEGYREGIFDLQEAMKQHPAAMIDFEMVEKMFSAFHGDQMSKGG